MFAGIRTLPDLCVTGAALELASQLQGTGHRDGMIQNMNFIYLIGVIIKKINRILIVDKLNLCIISCEKNA